MNPPSSVERIRSTRRTEGWPENPPLPSECAYLGFDDYRDIAPICNAVFGGLCNTCRCPRAPTLAP